MPPAWSGIHREVKRLALAAALAVLAMSPPREVQARPNRYAVEPPEVEKTPAFRYAAMEPEACLAELRARSVPFTAVVPPPPAQPGVPRAPYPRGVTTPLRLAGPVRGVRFRHADPAVREAEVLESVADCPLVLAIDDLAYVLRQYAVTEVDYFSMYRPGWTRPGVRHPAAPSIWCGCASRTGAGTTCGRISGRASAPGLAARARRRRSRTRRGRASSDAWCASWTRAGPSTWC
jgi:hypothetical protein